MHNNQLDTSFTIKYGGETNQVDAMMFINSLINTTTIIQEINKELCEGKKIDIKIRAIEKGSFLVHIDLMESFFETIQTIFTCENICTTSAIIGIFVDLLSLKSIMKSEKPEIIQADEKSILLKDSNNNQIEVSTHTYNIYINNPIVKDSIEQNYATITSDPSIQSFEILSPSGVSLFKSDREEFKDLAVREEVIENDEKTITETSRLHIVKASFDPSLTWEFYFKGNRIAVRIKDPKFYEQIDKGKPFSKGDVLEVELIIKQKWDSAVNTFVNKSYSIARIINHIPRNEQQKMKFDDTAE
jgi:hypothetical protein